LAIGHWGILAQKTQFLKEKTFEYYNILSTIVDNREFPANHSDIKIKNIKRCQAKIKKKNFIDKIGDMRQNRK
jgi:predicted nucleic-acid-binding protein